MSGNYTTESETRFVLNTNKTDRGTYPFREVIDYDSSAAPGHTDSEDKFGSYDAHLLCRRVFAYFCVEVTKKHNHSVTLI